jgi:hypothetical protein
MINDRSKLEVRRLRMAMFDPRINYEEYMYQRRIEEAMRYEIQRRQEMGVNPYNNPYNAMQTATQSVEKQELPQAMLQEKPKSKLLLLRR